MSEELKVPRIMSLPYDPDKSEIEYILKSEYDALQSELDAEREENELKTIAMKGGQREFQELQSELDTLKQAVKDAVGEIDDMDVTGEIPYRVRDDVLGIFRSHGLIKE